MAVEMDSLPTAISLDGSEIVPIVQGGTAKRTTTAAIAAQTTPDLDTISSTQGAVMYRGATAWSGLSPGTSGQFLITGGAAANPSWSTTLGAANGGTGLTSYAVGDILYASGATTLAKLADIATGNALISGGVTTAPSWGKIGLTTHVDGTLPVANGGTALTAGTSGGVLAYTATGVLASSATLAANQIVIGGGAGAVPATLGSLGTTSTLLRGNAAGAPTWGALTSGDVTGALAYTPANKAGETFTGNINIDKDYPTFWLDANTGTSAYVFGVKNGSERWLIELGNGVSESGANVGTNFAIHRYSDAGAWIGAPIEINRATGVVSINGGVAWHSGNDGSGSGLDADTLDGANLDTAYSSFGNGTIPVRHASGYLFSNYFNATADDIGAGAPSHVAVQAFSDNYYRWQTLANFTAQVMAAAVYTGSTALETALPVGHTILVNTGSAVDKNSTTTVYAGSTNSDSYNIAATGSALSGTWRSRGSIAGYSIFQRVA